MHHEDREPTSDEMVRHLRRWFELANDLLLVTGGDGRILVASPALRRVVGTTNGDLVGTSAFDLLHPTDLAEAHAGFARATATADPITLEARLRRPDGGFRRISWKLRASRDEGLVYAVGRELAGVPSIEPLPSPEHHSFRQLVESSPFGVYAVDADFRLVLVSKGAQKVFENVRPLIGRDFDDVLRQIWEEPFATEAIGRFRHTLETGEAFHAPSTVEQRHDIAGVESYDWKIDRVILHDGRPGVVCHFYDLSERQRYEQALRQAEAEHRRSEERFRQLAEAMPQLVWTASDDGTVLYYNSRAERYDGLGKEPDGSWSWKALVHPDHLESTVRTWKAAVETKEPYECEHRIRMADGTWRWHLSRALRVGPPAEPWFGTATDIHETKMAQERLRASERRFQRMADTAPAILWMTDTSGACTFLSRGWTELTGQTAEEGRGDGWLTPIHPDDRDRTFQTFREANAGREPFTMDYRLRTRQGSYRWIIDTARPRLDEGGTFGGYIGSVIDVHERKLAEQELQRLNDELTESDRRKDEFLAMLGHELRNPLAAIRSATASIKITAPDVPRLSRAQEILERQSVQMTRLVDGLLELSRIARGKIALERVPVDARRVIVDVVADHGSHAEDRHIRLETALPGDPVWVSADPVRWAQIVDNLVANAVKFTDADGSIQISLGVEGEQAVLRVRDTGIGMRPEMIERLFDAFHQETQELARSAGGLGLGLALARHLVELHDGDIRASSGGLGKGTELEVRLPLAAPPAESPAAESRPATPRLRILVVEDNVDAAHALQDLLEALGHRADVAYHGAQAVARLAREGADLVLCDLGLPGMSGYEVARAVRTKASTNAIPLVALTGYGRPEDRERSAEAGFDAHLTKPVDLPALEDLVARVADGSVRGPLDPPSDEASSVG